ncbi:MAG TPA: cation:proton antiporter [Thermoanaerobaculia bacterium]|nr:cation:proton antiporter [Thermoanaerobaculia bacterium]
METFTAAPHDDVLKLTLQIAVLLLTARALGEVARRLGQPSVIGEIAAGILLGPSVLAGLMPAFGQWIVPSTPVQGYLIEVVSMIGAMFLMLITGLETDLGLIRRHARTAIGVSLGGIALTFTAGYFLGLHLPDTLLGDPAQRTVFALFLGTAMSISAIAVIAKVIIDMKLTRRDVGQTILAAGMSDDTIGWILLSAVASLALGQGVSAGSIGRTVGGVLLFMILSLTVGRSLLRRALQFVQERVTMADRMLTFAVILMFIWGAIAQALRFEAVLGAFIIGILLNQMRLFPVESRGTLESLALGIFAPIFFAVAGLKVDLGHVLTTPSLLASAAALILVTTLAKGTGTYLGARLIGRKDHWTALSFSAGLNTRGAMDIIIATIGLQLGVLSQDMFSIVVLMAMTNALAAPTALRWVLGHVQPTEEEVERLRQEELAEESFVASIHRILLPIRLRESISDQYVAEARILERLSQRSELSVTLLTATKPGGRSEGTEFLRKIAELFPKVGLRQKVAEGTSPSELILDEAHKGYDLIILGASQDSNTRVVFNPMVDYLLRVSPCATMVVKSYPMPPDWQLRRILVPTNGAPAARRAAEVAFALATEPEHEVVVMNVATRETSPLDTDGSYFRRQVSSGRGIVEELRALGEAQKVSTAAEVRVGRNPDRVILDVAREREIDLIVIGTDIRPGSQRLFLGPRVERILNNAPCPVLVVNAP